MEGYSVKVVSANVELTAKERVKIKDTSDAIKLDEATKDGVITITPDKYAVLGVHNEHSDNKEYNVYVIIDKSGEKYVTGSTAFWTSFTEIMEEMKDETEEFAIKVYRKDSKNYKGKQFITCSLA